jgi:hypothetical protein
MQHFSLSIPSSSLQELLQGLPESARNDFEYWRSRLEPVLKNPKSEIRNPKSNGVCARLRIIATQTGAPFKTVLGKYYAAKRGGIVALVDRRLAGPSWWLRKEQRSLSDSDKELVKLYCEKNQRSSRSAVKHLRLHFIRGAIKTETPINPDTGYPYGWSIDNLLRYAPTKYELKATRIGRSAADSERSLVYTTRKGLWVGSHYMFDDMWHDFEVNSFSERQAGRPLELFSHDLFAARKVRWGIRVRTRKDDDSGFHGLTERMTRFILAATLYLDGYSPRGTVCIEEQGTARLTRGNIERDLHDLSNGLITVDGGGMKGAKAHAGQYPGISRGNFRFKASLESSNNLTHNVFGALPGQTGKDRDHCPEEHAALMRNNADLLAARQHLLLSGVSPERVALLEYPILEINQFMQLAAELYRAIDEDPDHDLEGWIECGHVDQELLISGKWISQQKLLNDPAQSALALELIRAGQIKTRPRKMTRGEVWRSGAGELVRIPGHGVCAILGDDLATERRVRKNMFEFEDAEVGPGEHRYQALARTPNGEEVRLADRETYQTFVNPFAPEMLFVRRANGSYLGECRRIEKPCRADVEAVHRLCAARAKEEAELLAPIRARHLRDAREKTARHARNAAVLRSAPLTIEERSRAAALRDAQREVTDDDVTAAVEAGVSPATPEISAEEISNLFATDPQPENNDPHPW